MNKPNEQLQRLAKLATIAEEPDTSDLPEAPLGLGRQRKSVASIVPEKKRLPSGWTLMS